MFDKMLLTLSILRGDFAARFSRDEDGATAVEYGLMVALIAVAIAATVFALGGTLDGLFQDVDTCVGGGAC